MSNVPSQQGGARLKMWVMRTKHSAAVSLRAGRRQRAAGCSAGARADACSGRDAAARARPAGGAALGGARAAAAVRTRRTRCAARGALPRARGRVARGPAGMPSGRRDQAAAPAGGNVKALPPPFPPSRVPRHAARHAAPAAPPARPDAALRPTRRELRAGAWAQQRMRAACTSSPFSCLRADTSGARRAHSPCVRAAGCEYYTNCAACVADTTCGWCVRPPAARCYSPTTQRGASRPGGDALTFAPTPAAFARPRAGAATTRTTQAATASRCRAITTCVLARAPRAPCTAAPRLRAAAP
jgi:hypothetical protein